MKTILLFFMIFIPSFVFHLPFNPMVGEPGFPAWADGSLSGNTGQQTTEKKNEPMPEKEQPPPEKKAAECLKIEDFQLKGNNAFSGFRLKMRMKTWHSSLLPGGLGCLNEKWLEKDIQSLIDLYRKKGFPDVAITPILEKIGKDGVKITINIEEGLGYQLVFQGNEFFSDHKLKKKIDLSKKGNVNDSALRRGIKAIRDAYIDAGFQDVTVEYDKQLSSLDASGTSQEPETFDRSQEPGTEKISRQKEDDHDLDSQVIEEEPASWDVHIIIKEGRQRIVNALKISGNKNIEKKDILDAMILREKGMLEKGGFNSRVLEKDIQAIELLYLSRGYLHIEIKDSITIKTIEENGNKTDAVDIDIVVNEGVQTLVGSAGITGLGDAMPESEALKQISLKPGTPFREYMVRSDENALSMLISEMGYPHVRVKGNFQLKEKDSLADITWHVEKGPFIQFGEVIYKGNKRLKQSIIEKRVDITPGTPFSLKKVFDAEKNIRSIKAVKYVQVRSPELKDRKTPSDIEVVVQENKPYFVEAAAGYDTEKEFYLTSKVGDNNFAGREIDAWLEGRVSGIGFQTEAGLSKPFFMDTNINASCNVYYQDEEELNQDFGTKSWGISTGFSRLIFEHVTAGLNFKYENRTMYGGDDADMEDPRNILVTTFMLGYDTRDSAMRPTKGFLSSGSVDIYAGFDNDLDRFLKYKLDIRKYTTPFDKITFALRTKLGYIEPFGSENTVAEDQFFFLGGTPDVRGFKENMLDFDENGDPQGGRSSINSTLEARIDLPANFELNCFFDTGRIDDLDSDAESKGFRSSIGAGIRYVTPIGPVGLLYGHKLDPEDGESSGRIHFSVGYTF